MPRLRPPRNPVTLHFDGRSVLAERGEPAAVSLLAGGHLALARSPKFHRPRGPFCLRGACDGCLARVDDVPNVMTCRVPAHDGMRIETQNVVGTPQTDLLRAADWFFPEGMNHHELFARVPGAQRVLQVLARRVAGLGKLPGPGAQPAHRPAERRDADVLVVGAGASGMATALALVERGRRVEVLEDDLAWGGSVRALGAVEPERWEVLWGAFGEAVAASRLALRLRTTAIAVYGDDVLVADEGGVEVVSPRTLVLAPGAHDGVPAFAGNDVPGVLSARAGCWLLAAGVSLGKRVVVTVAPWAGPFGEAFARAVPEAVLVRGYPAGVRGSARVREVTIRSGSDEQRLPCDALLVDAPGAPAYELCAQAGAELAHETRGFVVRAPAGRVRAGVFVVGEAAGTALESRAVVQEAAAVSGAIAEGT